MKLFFTLTLFSVFLAFRAYSGDHVAIEYRSSFLDSFYEGKACVKLNGKVGYINKDGRYFIPPKFEWGSSFEKGLAAVKQNGKIGIITNRGDFLVTPKYEDLARFAGSFVVRLDGKYGLIGPNGKTLVLPRYDKYACIGDNVVFSVEKRCEREFTRHSPVEPKKAFVFDSKGCLLRKMDLSEYDVVFFCKYVPVAIVRKHGLMGLIDLRGDLLLKPSYERICFEYGNYATVSKDGKNGLIDRDGKVILPLTNGKFEVYPKEKRLLLERNGKSALYDFELNKISADFDVEMAYSFENSVLPIKTRNALMHISKDGEVIRTFDAKYEFISPFINGVADFLLEGAGKSGILDASLKVIVPPEYHFIFPLPEGIIFAENCDNNQSRFGLFDMKGKVLLPCEYQRVGGHKGDLFTEGLCPIVQVDDQGLVAQMGYINKKGELVLVFDFKTKTFKKVNDNSTLTHKQEHSKQK